METIKRALGRAWAVGTGVVSLSGSAAAQTLPAPDVDCAALPNPVFVEAGDTQMNLLGDLARKLRDDVTPMTLVYLPRSTCTLTENLYRGKPTTEVMRYVPSSSEQPSWDGTPRQCNNRPVGSPIDLGVGATFLTSCSSDIQSLKPADIRIFRGPAQGYGFVVPEGVIGAVPGITREEAYFVFAGRGREANAVPWVAEPNPASGTPSVFIRGVTTSTLLTMASNVAPELLPAAKWIGYRLTGQQDRSTVVIQGVSLARGTPLEQMTIGILGSDLYDRNRDKLDLLAYQGKDQRFGYYPDSSASARDKRNLRDGHYLPWSYTEYLARVDDGGAPVNANVARLLRIVTGDVEVRLRSAPGVTPPFDIDALSVVASNGLVPDCAMKVSREVDGGEFALYAPEAPCGCFFETVQDPSLVTSPAPEWVEDCRACTSDDNCAPGKCRRGYCEVN